MTPTTEELQAILLIHDSLIKANVRRVIHWLIQAELSRREAEPERLVLPNGIVVPDRSDPRMQALLRFEETTTDDGTYDIDGAMVDDLIHRGWLCREKKRGQVSVTGFGSQLLAATHGHQPTTQEKVKPAKCVCGLARTKSPICQRHSGSDDDYCLTDLSGGECGHDRACHGGACANDGEVV